MQTFLVAVLLIGAAFAAVLWVAYNHSRREAFIRETSLPQGLFEKLRKRHPHLTIKDCQLVAQGLRQFFMTHLKSGRKFVSMPSQVVDDLWHEFILYTKHYDRFCQGAFGRFLHHTPAAVLGRNRDNNAGLRRCWWYACREENINPRAPTRLPLLFALDAKLRIPDGFVYLPDCKGVRRQGAHGDGATPYCGGDFSSGAIDGGTDGFADGGGDRGFWGASSDGDGSSGDSGGCGGGGCGGGGD